MCITRSVGHKGTPLVVVCMCAERGVMGGWINIFGPAIKQKSHHKESSDVFFLAAISSPLIDAMLFYDNRKTPATKKGFLLLDPLSICLTLLMQNLIRIKWSALSLDANHSVKDTQYKKGRSRIKGNTVYVYGSFSTVKCSMIQGQWCGKSPDLFILPDQTGYRVFYGCGQSKNRTISHVTASWVCAS